MASLHTPERHLSAAPRCDRPVSGDGVMSFHCSLPLGHDLEVPSDPEPCFAVESSRSARLWSAWKDRRIEAARHEVESPRTVTIGCPACSKVAMVFDPATGVGRCENCGESAHAQADPEPQPTETIEDIEADAAEVPVWKVLQDMGGAGDRGGPTSSYFMESIPEGEFRLLPVPPEPTKQRDGDQVLPNKGHMAVQDWIIDAMEESKRVGTERYGQPLMTFDGRLNIRDLAEELRDAFVYISKLQMTAEADKSTLVEMVTQGLDWEFNANGLDIDSLVIPVKEIAEIAVDRILDWVLAQKIGTENVSPER